MSYLGSGVYLGRNLEEQRTKGWQREAMSGSDEGSRI